MSASTGMSMPTAILLASGLIAGSIFLGLRSQAPALPTTAPATQSPVAPPAPQVVVPPVVAPPVASRESVARRASEALAYQRSSLRDLCYRPAALAAGAELRAEWTLNVTFDAQGTQLARGMVEHRDTSTPELTRCIGDQMQPLMVPPPGATIMVEIPLSFP
ncbi:MAG: hypothetical protein H0T76_27030 [Nannocystis sp.]|nr:hypothetical protein [Nannocystis sp.]MBA3550149.1 hypothetical protein [Nannocystis sp.]